ncbi:MAG: S-adenosylmethionine:tRNA ribosyltransferase-isomerase [Phycisphaerales bacterium]|nr:S-adenosylmethionine:tRNA ribosyltransferase-isomerase [Phycisphaerales bacterium]
MQVPSTLNDLAASELEYPLDASLIATNPADPRDQARMLVFHQKSGRVEHRKVADLQEYLPAGSALIVNQTRVAPLRFVARRLSDGRETEGLFLWRAADERWAALIKGSKKFHPGDVLELCPAAESAGSERDRITLHSRRDMHWEVALASGSDAARIWERSGRIPIPPYILQARRAAGVTGGDESLDRSQYQTVFSQESELPSCAAPTAGLHFTNELLSRIAAQGVERIAIELQVGTGTFRPVDAELLSKHPMHHEHCRMSARDALLLSAVNRDLSLVVGTTSVRLLESLPHDLPPQIVAAAQAMVAAGHPAGTVMDFVTNILITPGFEFQWTKRLLTNFHLPRSTLLALVGAMVGLDQLKELYALAQSERYRFYSFGDAMLVQP